MAQVTGNSNTEPRGRTKGSTIKWIVILVIAVVVGVIVYFAFIRKEPKDIADSNLVYTDDTGQKMPVCNLSPSTAYAASTFNPTHASQLSMAKCKSTVAKQCRTLPLGNSRTVCKTELTKCVCSKNGGK